MINLPTNTRIFKGLITTALILSGLYNTSCNQPQTAPPGTDIKHQEKGSLHEAEEVELVMLMGKLQLYMNKVYFAGVANNRELRDFYIHEMEEVMDVIVEGGITHEGVDISQNMKMYGAAQLAVFEEALGQGNDFTDAYNELINACNSCHKASKYPFIIIKEPTKPVFDNQVYSAP